jgi:CRISPR-associated protein Csm2
VHTYDDEKGEGQMTQQGEQQELKDLREWGKDLGKKVADLNVVTAATLVEIADLVGKHLVNGTYKRRNEEKRIDLKVNQIRRFLDSVRKIEANLKGKRFEEVKDAIMLLRPKLAYAAGREDKVKPLMNVLDPAIKSAATAENDENFKKLLRLIEGIVAYHKFYGGSN